MNTAFADIIDKYQGVAPNRVIQAVQAAAQKTGADFAFLMEKAQTESGFNASAKAKGSSATGLFQFIDSTWLRMVKEHGAKFGLGNLADQISEKDGKLCVDDCDAKKKILELRKDPHISALMAGEFSAENKNYLAAHINGPVGKTEMYLAHFLGANGASRMINAREKNGDMAAMRVLPKEARANKNVFFDQKTGEARTLNEVYDFFAKKFEGPTVTAKINAPALTQIAASQEPAARAFVGASMILPPPPPVDTVLRMYQNMNMDATSLLYKAERRHTESMMSFSA